LLPITATMNINLIMPWFSTSQLVYPEYGKAVIICQRTGFFFL
jgi:hypothetical protein